MKVISIDRMPSVKRAEVIFEGGTADIKMLIDRPVGAEETEVAIVTFFPGTKTKMHSHYHEQLLYIPSGKGIVANEHEEHGATLGKVFLIPAGEEHWHGATEDSSFSHLFIFNPATETTY